MSDADDEPVLERPKAAKSLAGKTFYLGSCGICMRSLYTPAAVIDTPGQRKQLVHPQCKHKGSTPSG
jgi:hypothetical protein